MKKLTAIICSLIIMMVPMSSFATLEKYDTCGGKLSFKADTVFNYYVEPFGTIFAEYLDDYDIGSETLFELENNDTRLRDDNIRIRAKYIYCSSGLKDTEKRDLISEYIDEEHWATVLDEEPTIITNNKGNLEWLRLKCCWEEDGDFYAYMCPIADEVIALVILDSGDEESTNRIMEKRDLEIADSLVKTFKDKGYAKEGLGRYNDGDYEDSEEDDSDFDAILAILTFVATVIPFIIGKDANKGKKKKKNETFTFNTFNGETVEIETPFGTEDNEDDSDDYENEITEIVAENEEKIIEDDEEEIIEEDEEIIEEETIAYEKETGIEENNIVENEIEIASYPISYDSKDDKQSYSSDYEKGLKSLYKSGIMTKKEFDEMLKKYYSNIEVKKKREEE